MQALQACVTVVVAKKTCCVPPILHGGGSSSNLFKSIKRFRQQSVALNE